jgi:integrase
MAKVAKRRDRYVLDYRDQYGIRRWETLPAGTTRKEADHRLSTRLQQIRNGEYQARCDELTFDELADAYIRNHVRVHLRDSAGEDYRYLIAFHLRPYFGRRRIRSIAMADVENFRGEMLAGLPKHAQNARAQYLAERSEAKAERRSDPDLARTADDLLPEVPLTVGARTAGKCIGLLSMMFRYALRHRWMTYNPCDGIRKPKITNRRVDRSEILSPSEIRALLAHADGRWKVMLSVAVYCGLRSGEIRGLQWGDIEWATRRLWVRRAADARGRKLQLPKTSAGVRSVGIPDHLIAELKHWKLASPANDLDLVFPTGAGRIENASNFLNRGLAPALRRAGIRRIDIHSLRHAYASLMIEAGVNLKRLQIFMGHSSFRVTMDTYAHLVPDVRDDAVNRLAEIVLTAPQLEAPKETGSKMVATPFLEFENSSRSERNTLIKNGSPGRTRTSDQRINSPSLYH